MDDHSKGVRKSFLRKKFIEHRGSLGDAADNSFATVNLSKLIDDLVPYIDPRIYKTRTLAVPPGDIPKDSVLYYGNMTWAGGISDLVAATNEYTVGGGSFETYLAELGKKRLTPNVEVSAEYVRLAVTIWLHVHEDETKVAGREMSTMARFANEGDPFKEVAHRMLDMIGESVVHHAGEEKDAT